MTRLFLITLISLSCISCGNKQGDNDDVAIFHYDKNVKIIPSKAKPHELNDGYEYGRFESCEYSGYPEKNLIEQFSSYNKALIVGDVQNCKKYVWPKSISYYKKYHYPNLSEDKILDDFLNDATSDFGKFYRYAHSQGALFEIVIPFLESKITYEDYIFIVFTASSNLIAENYAVHNTDYERTLGISENGGKNWWFIAINSMTPNILCDFPEKVVNEIMNY